MDSLSIRMWMHRRKLKLCPIFWTQIIKLVVCIFNGESVKPDCISVSSLKMGKNSLSSIQLPKKA